MIEEAEIQDDVTTDNEIEIDADKVKYFKV
jgi:hypothetical protein